MVKNVDLCIDLKTVMQKTTHLVANKPYRGILTRTGKYRYRFEETVQKGGHPRNPKLFDGKFLSMVRKKDGKYQLHLKTMETKALDHEDYAARVYYEIIDALSIID